MKPLQLAISCLALVATSAFPQEDTKFLGRDALFNSVNELKVQIRDGVEDGCMPQPTSMKTAVEAALIRNGFTVVDDVAAYTFVVAPTGYATGPSSCAVYLTAGLEGVAYAAIPYSSHDHTFLPWQAFNGVLLTGPKAGMQERLQREALEIVDKLLISVTQAKNRLKRETPELYSRIRKNKSSSESATSAK